MVNARAAMFVLLLLASSITHGAQFAPDPAFGNGGTAVLDYSALGGTLADIAIQPDGKPVVSGSYVIGQIGFGVGSQSFIARLTTDGSTDASFFGGPIVQYEAPDLLVQRDGRVLIALRSLVARYLPDGTLDGPFAFAAATAVNALADSFDAVDFALQADGKVIVAGNVPVPDAAGEVSQGVQVLRFNTDGTLDTTFASAGRWRFPVLAGFDAVAAIAALPQGKLAIAVNHSPNPGPGSTFVMRLNADGTPDATFGTAGRSVGLPDETATALVTQRGVGLVLFTASQTIAEGRIRRLAGAGVFDPTFGSAGIVRVADDQVGASVVVQPDGTLLVATGTPTAIRSYRADGAVDAAFGVNGVLPIPTLSSINAMALGPEGALWLAGVSTQLASSQALGRNGNPAVVRLLPSSIAAVEFYNAPRDHYFISTNPQEIAALDIGTFEGWTRTGNAFAVFGPDRPDAGATVPVCRFYLPPAFGDSHFFSASQSECDDIARRFPQFIPETSDAMRVTPADPASGACASAGVPVYRLWNARPDTNHRYVTDRATRDAMVARGWVSEGYGEGGVAFCAAAP